MGTAASKPNNTPVVLHGSTPVRFSSALVDTLASSPTDSTREAQLELHIQSRISSELSKLEARESEILASLEHSDATKEDGLDRKKVLAEIEGLRARLESAPRLVEVQEGVRGAREGVVACLTANRTRPLDCWKEVEEFKLQTRRLEKQFVVRTVGREY